jgi:hypothetical protein
MLNLGRGQGVESKAGFGQIHHQRFAKPFKKALHRIMAVHHLPKGNVIREAFTERILIDFKNDLQRRFAVVYDGADDWPKKMSIPSLVDNCTIAFGTLTGSIVNSPVSC